MIDHEQPELKAIEKLIEQKLEVVEETDYLKEKIVPGRILGYKNFQENGKEVYKKKTRKSD